MSVFSKITADCYIHQGKYFFVVFDKYPVSQGHTLIISKEEKQDYFDLNDFEKTELHEMIDFVKNKIDELYAPDGYNIGMNCGISAGQTIMHFHCHVIPRYKGDMKDPSGGIRHCIEGRGYY
jgi:diadenosine tetraphosphate (Ap4A) HIT family hydrolase